MIADDAFALMENLMKPYPQRHLSHEQRIYNYRLSRARRMVESGFGILVNRWRILLNPIHLNAEKVETITLACVVFHNFLCSQTSTYINGNNSEPEITQTQLQHISHQGSNQSTSSAKSTRDNFKDYFNSNIGLVPWQTDAVARGNM
ncbi:hypothetical protein RN001_011902 [Aquatica leii]|uniref:DDE Tnp4 domain-containing protein n=1 Tax=Aquatica leii TaxID=1421715 RepID=A0AAN7Q162_9COLE|nr:hypothetical protein RN001_011902 [Aquatica leii]